MSGARIANCGLIRIAAAPHSEAISGCRTARASTANAKAKVPNASFWPQRALSSQVMGLKR